jgi:crossover junction endodeoxyribonuclease RuvC
LQKPLKIILGIDPGTVIMGYSVISVKGSQISLLEMDVLKMSSKRDPYERLELIHTRVGELIKQFKPQSFAIEAPFFGKNVQSMLKLGRAQGVAIAAAIQSGLEVTEYSPRKIKQSITGNGNADKQQVWKMLCNITSIVEEPKYMDASDALAVAICHHFQTTSILNTGSKKLKDWGDFIKNNPGRIV